MASEEALKDYARVPMETVPEQCYGSGRVGGHWLGAKCQGCEDEECPAYN